jgi:hypothetical protein
MASRICHHVKYYYYAVWRVLTFWAFYLSSVQVRCRHSAIPEEHVASIFRVGDRRLLPAAPCLLLGLFYSEDRD